MGEEQVLEKLKEAFSVPEDGEIAAKITCEVLGIDVTDKRWMKSNFSNLVEEIQLKAYAHYQNAERPAAQEHFARCSRNACPKPRNPKISSSCSMIVSGCWTDSFLGWHRDDGREREKLLSK